MSGMCLMQRKYKLFSLALNDGINKVLLYTIDILYYLGHVLRYFLLFNDNKLFLLLVKLFKFPRA